MLMIYAGVPAMSVSPTYEYRAKPSWVQQFECVYVHVAPGGHQNCAKPGQKEKERKRLIVPRSMR